VSAGNADKFIVRFFRVACNEWTASSQLASPRQFVSKPPTRYNGSFNVARVTGARDHCQICPSPPACERSPDRFPSLDERGIMRRLS
jgi:hypothetical protein